MKLFGKIIGCVLLGVGLAATPLRAQDACMSDGLTKKIRAEYPNGHPDSRPSLESNQKVDADFTYVIPVVFHLMHANGAVLNVSVAQLESQIEILNEDFNRYGRGFNTDDVGASVNIRFCLASLDPDGNPTPGYDQVFYPASFGHDPFTDGVDEAMKELAVWDVDRYLNIYIVRQITNGQTSGYAYLPGDAAGTVFDGVVADYRQVGRFTGTAIALGHTVAHEVGHYLDLYHPWGLNEGQCGTNDDECDDTPEVEAAFYSTYPGCNGPISCDLVPRQISNFMDYSDDRCLNLFTDCQSGRMRRAILNYRSELVSASNLESVGCGEAINQVNVTNDITIFPNPANEVLMISVDTETDETVMVEMYDFAGRLVRKIDPASSGRGAIPINTSVLNPGFYHLIVQTGSTYERRTIAVLH